MQDLVYAFNISIRTYPCIDEIVTFSAEMCWILHYDKWYPPLHALFLLLVEHSSYVKHDYDSNFDLASLIRKSAFLQ